MLLWTLFWYTSPFSYLGITSGIDTDMIGLLLYMTTGPTYTKSMEHYICNVTGLPHILSSNLFTHLSSSTWDLMHTAIPDVYASRSLRKAWAPQTLDSHDAIAHFTSVIFLSRSLSVLDVFTLLHSMLLVSISGRDSELPRKSSVVGTASSGSRDTVFNDEAMCWHGSITILWPVEWTVIWLVIDDVNKTIMHLGPSPSYPACPPSCPSSYWFTSMTCHNTSWAVHTPCTFTWVCQHITGCSSHMVCTWPCVGQSWILLV